MRIMTGHQFTVFLDSADQASFEQTVRKSGDITFLRDRSPSSRPEELPDSVIRRFGEERLGILIARRADLSDIRFQKIEGRNDFSCDPTTQLAIEFSRCYVTNTFIRAGRLYRVDEFFDMRRARVLKSAEFIEWGERLFHLAKGALHMIENGIYAGGHALQRRKGGVKFEGLDGAVG